MSDFDDHHIITELPKISREKMKRPLEDNLLDAYRFFAKLPSKVPAVEL